MAVYFGENVMKVSSCMPFCPFSQSCVFPLHPQQTFELETNVKREKNGRRKMEGWTRKVFGISLCQQAKMPVRKPGRRRVDNEKATLPAKTAGSGDPGPSRIEPAKEKPLATRTKQQEKNMRMKRGERSPLKHLFCSGRIRHGPTFKFLARPKDEVMTDVENAVMNRTMSFPLSP